MNSNPNPPHNNNLDALSEEELLTLVQQSLHCLPDAVDPTDEPPVAVLDGARWIHEWVNLETELAELTFDSTQSRELAGVRSTASPLRELTFVTEDLTIELEITPGPRSTTISGTIDPPTVGNVQLLIDGQLFSGDLDVAGNFEIRYLPAGNVLAMVQVGSNKIRLGSFEI